MEMAQDCNQRVFETTFAASITPLKTTLFASETAISGTGLQSAAVGPHYLQLNGRRTADPLVLLLTSPCLGEVYPHEPVWERQLSRLNRVV